MNFHLTINKKEAIVSVLLLSFVVAIPIVRCAVEHRADDRCRDGLVGLGSRGCSHPQHELRREGGGWVCRCLRMNTSQKESNATDETTRQDPR